MRIRQEGVKASVVMGGRHKTSVIIVTYVGTDQAPSKKVTEDQRAIWD